MNRIIEFALTDPFHFITVTVCLMGFLFIVFVGITDIVAARSRNKAYDAIINELEALQRSNRATHRFWLSDLIDIVERVRDENGKGN